MRKYGQKAKIQHDEALNAPKTVAEARRQVFLTFIENNWNEDEQKRYSVAKGVGEVLVADMNPDQIRTIHAAMVQSRMILLKKQ